MRQLLLTVILIFVFTSCSGALLASKPTVITPPKEDKVKTYVSNYVRTPKIKPTITKQAPKTTATIMPPQIEERVEDLFMAELAHANTVDKPVEFDIPVVINSEVQYWISYFLGNGKRSFKRALGRSTRYLPMMKKIFREKGLPEDLVYLSLIESNFVVTAYSRARAMGLWQFIPGTARIYGLEINSWIDERRHPEKATRAAAEYLSYLHEMFGSWYLAAAAYNAGEGRIQRGLKKCEPKTFWELSRRRLLKRETRNYVPKFLAALILAKEPVRYGLIDVDYAAPLEYDIVVVDKPTDLTVIARLTGSAPNEIRRLNPDLRRGHTPLNKKTYKVHVPVGSARNFKKNYAELKPSQRLPVFAHRIKRGENLGLIARQYNVSVQDIKSYNNLRSNIIRAGKMLKIPSGLTVRQKAQRRYQAKPVRLDKYEVTPKGRRVVYHVRPGDNPWSIAQRYNILWTKIAIWNNITDVRRIMPGQKLILYLPEKTVSSKTESPQPLADAKTYTVRAGDTLWDIARRFKVRPSHIVTLNNIKNNIIRPGDVLTFNTGS